VGGGENYEQKKGARKGKILSTMEGMYGGRRHIGKQRKLEERHGIGRRV